MDVADEPANGCVLRLPGRLAWPERFSAGACTGSGGVRHACGGGRRHRTLQLASKPWPPRCSRPSSRRTCWCWPIATSTASSSGKPLVPEARRQVGVAGQVQHEAAGAATVARWLLPHHGLRQRLPQARGPSGAGDRLRAAGRGHAGARQLPAGGQPPRSAGGAPAVELAALYHERREIAGVFDEFKTHLRAKQHGTVQQDTAAKPSTRAASNAK